MTDCKVFPGPGAPELAPSVAELLSGVMGDADFQSFPDGEVSVRLDESVRGCSVVLVHSTTPEPHLRLFETFAFADACRRAGADRVTAVLPYLAYARADARHGSREPLTARVVADLLQTAGIDHVLTVDAHSPQVEGFFAVPVDNLTAVPLLAEALAADLPDDAVVVAPDLGAARLASAYAERLGLTTAVLHKRRTSGAEVEITDLTGEVEDRRCVLVDDMISTGGTLVAAIESLAEAGSRSDVTVAATHGLLVDGAVDDLREAGVRRLLVTDSVAHVGGLPEPVTVVSLARLLAEAVRRRAAGASLTALESPRTAELQNTTGGGA